MIFTRATTELHQHPHELLGDALLGLNDGVATTLVFALSVAGASGSYSPVILAGLAEMLAGGVSMFLGGFVSAQSEKDAAEHQISVEQHEIEYEPEEEREELLQIYREKGFTGRQLTGIVDHLTSDKERWLNSMIRDELLLRPGEFRSPWRVGAAVGISFILGAFVPVFPFLMHFPAAPAIAAVLSLAALFATGAARARYSRRTWLRSGAEMVLVGVIGTLAGLAIGKLLSIHPGG
ncbi:MAG: VIT1/CCC1 transporter family protein [Chloroflexi bacterium]|nr:VIT1/CCC1 transporter family protein [Chloroflexota bacterium]